MGSESMHTHLSLDGRWCDARQPMLVYAEIGKLVNPQRVLEVGCGRGHCTLLLAASACHIQFYGLDLLAEHATAAAEAATRCHLSNAHFLCGDMLRMEPLALLDVDFGALGSRGGTVSGRTPLWCTWEQGGGP